MFAELAALTSLFYLQEHIYCMGSQGDLEKRIKVIEERNSSVEIDKDWETSKTRRVIIAIFTYAAISIYMYAVNIPNPWINSVVPTVGFMLSTLTLPFFKKVWARNREKG